MPDQGIWSGTVELPKGTILPFRMNLDLRSATPAGWFLVGNEQIPIPEISRNGDSLTFRFSEYGAEMRGDWNGRRWTGAYVRYRPDGTTSLKFTASPEAFPKSNPRGESLPITAPTGKYQVYFQDQDRKAGATAATLWMEAEVMYGTFIAPDGDYGLLTGKPRGSSVQLNRFTGWQAMAIVMEHGGGTWSGKLYTQSEKPRAFTLEPATGVDVETPSALRTALKDPGAGFTFDGVSAAGEMVRSTDERFQGKALVVDIMGTWCHNCLDEAPLLQQLQKEYGDRGLEVVGLSFEISGDSDVAKKNLKLYKDRFGLTYTLLFCGSIDEPNVKNRLRSQLDNFFAYPTTLFINREGKVHAIRSGFKGPGTGEEFQSQVQSFHNLAKQLVN